MTIEEKAKRYDDLLVKLQEAKVDDNVCDERYCCVIDNIVPELKESDDERIGKALITYFSDEDESYDGIPYPDIRAWLEKQCELSSWKPSKDEMDALYGLAYITNKMDDKKDEAVTKLYQDLKREFFDGASYENMFPSSPVDAPIKEVDLEKELIQWHKNHFERNGTFIGMNGFYLENASQIDIARHFFELGLKAQKG